jgi:hypothetical protein
MNRWRAIAARFRRLPSPVKIIGGLGALVGLILGVIQLYNKVFPPPEPAERSFLHRRKLAEYAPPLRLRRYEARGRQA